MTTDATILLDTATREIAGAVPDDVQKLLDRHLPVLKREIERGRLAKPNVYSRLADAIATSTANSVARYMKAYAIRTGGETFAMN